MLSSGSCRQTYTTFCSSFDLILQPNPTLSKPTLKSPGLLVSWSPAQATLDTILMWHLPWSRGSRAILAPEMS